MSELRSCPGAAGWNRCACALALSDVWASLELRAALATTLGLPLGLIELLLADCLGDGESGTGIAFSLMWSCGLYGLDEQLIDIAGMRCRDERNAITSWCFIGEAILSDDA